MEEEDSETIEQPKQEEQKEQVEQTEIKIEEESQGSNGETPSEEKLSPFEEQKPEEEPEKEIEGQPNQQPVKVEIEKFLGFDKIDWSRFKNKKLWITIGIILALALIVLLAVWIRTQNIPQLKDVTTNSYTLGPDLDPFLFLRHAQEISEGRLKNPDIMRLAPIGVQNYAKTSLMPWAIVFIYRIFAIETIEFAAIIAPVIFFALTLIVFFLFMSKIFSSITNKKKALLIALIATAFYVVIPPMLHRTTAGIPEIESLGMLWFWSAFYFFTSAWQENRLKKQILFGVLAGIFTGLMIFTWGGYRYLFMAFALASFIAFFFNKQKKRNLLIYLSWSIPSLIFAFAKNPNLGAFTVMTDTGLAFGILFVLVIDTLIFNTKLKKIKKRIRLPESIISLIVIVILSLIILLAINPILISQTASKVTEGLLYPFGRGRVGLTVAENRAPYFIEVLGSFGALFWLFFFGALLLFYEATKHFSIKNKTVLNLFFIIFMLSFIFSRISPQSVFNGVNFISRFFYFGGLGLFTIVLLCMYINAYRKKDEKTLEDFANINFSYILILVFLFWMVISMRGAIRLFFIISPAIIMASVFLVFKLSEYSFKAKDNLAKLLLWCAVIVVTIFLITTFISYTKTTKQAAKWTIPSAYNQQWQKAMAWTRENTPENAIFVHWWDYGYFFQTLGERATVTDGGHANRFWDHATARYLMTAQHEKTALQLCRAYNVSYFLIDSTDIGKYPAYSSIGSDESDNDRLSWVSTFVLNEKETQELRNGTRYVYTGGTMLDEDIIWKGQLFPRNKAGIGAFYVTANENNEIVNVEAVFVYNNKATSIPIKYIYINGKLINVVKDEEAINSALYIFPRLNQGINERGAAFYLSERAIKTQWVRLYLLNETENFELVHNEPSIYIQQLRDDYNISVGDFLLANEFLGPIKIWKINYPDDIEIHKEYLQLLLLEENFASLDYLGT